MWCLDFSPTITGTTKIYIWMDDPSLRYISLNSTSPGTKPNRTQDTLQKSPNGKGSSKRCTQMRKKFRHAKAKVNVKRIPPIGRLTLKFKGRFRWQSRIENALNWFNGAWTAVSRPPSISLNLSAINIQLFCSIDRDYESILNARKTDRRFEFGMPNVNPIAPALQF